MGIENQALIFSTNNLPGFDQMALDVNSLDKTISNPEIILTLRFYYWTGDWLSIGYHQKEIFITKKIIETKLSCFRCLFTNTGSIYFL